MLSKADQDAILHELDVLDQRLRSDPANRRSIISDFAARFAEQYGADGLVFAFTIRELEKGRGEPPGQCPAISTWASGQVAPAIPGAVHQQLQACILRFFDENDLTQALLFHCNVALDAIVGPGPLEVRVFHAIAWFARNSRVNDLLLAIEMHRPAVPELYTALASIRAALGPTPPPS